jgi:hypothetical protein
VSDDGNFGHSVAFPPRRPPLHRPVPPVSLMSCGRSRTALQRTFPAALHPRVSARVADNNDFFSFTLSRFTVELLSNSLYSRPSRLSAVMKDLGSVSRGRKERDFARTISTESQSASPFSSGSRTADRHLRSGWRPTTGQRAGKTKKHRRKNEEDEKTESFRQRARRRLAFGTDAACSTTQRGTMRRWVRPMSMMEGTALARSKSKRKRKKLAGCLGRVCLVCVLRVDLEGGDCL